jgi:hypothetical protein
MPQEERVLPGPVYLGDDVYASFDGRYIYLHIGASFGGRYIYLHYPNVEAGTRSRRQAPTYCVTHQISAHYKPAVVALETSTLDALDLYRKRCVEATK